MTNIGMPFVTRNPTDSEVKRFQLCMSTFGDGSGQVKEKDGTTRPGWRDFERIVAEVLNGDGQENKEIFDVIVQSPDDTDIYYGISVKSKELPLKGGLEILDHDSHVHMEISNSPAKFWTALYRKDVTEADFRNQQKKELIGNTVLEVVESWHIDAKNKFESHNPGKTLDLDQSVYMTISYDNSKPRKFQIHSFNLMFPKGIRWNYISEKCLRGSDPDSPQRTIIDWYALSGGQLKYYPLAVKAKFKSPCFNLVNPDLISIMQKAKGYWPENWID